MKTKIYNKLQELEKTQEQFWNITHECGNFLNLLIKSCDYKNIVEVGTSNGYSGIWLAMAAKEISGYVISMEFHQCRIDLAEPNFKYCELDKYIEVRQGYAKDVINSLKPSDYKSSQEKFIDFAFVDANKGEYIQYFQKLDKLLRKGGMLAFDNVTSHENKITDFLDTISKKPSYQLSFLTYGGGLLLALKLD